MGLVAEGRTQCPLNPSRRVRQAAAASRFLAIDVLQTSSLHGCVHPETSHIEERSIRFRSKSGQPYSAAWVCNIADITRDELYVDVHA
jgi:hypothetical protein